ncbi:MAG: peptidoglycan editing factor PgeF [Clostridia bacterium]|nr:peptidoglycan editing factor PgeF [Clostridia bacterium]
MLDRINDNEKISFKEKNGVVLIQFKNLKKYEDILIHGFTTRFGGVSTGECRTMNLGFNRNDIRENVLENYKRVAETLEINYEHMVFSNQVHDSKVKVVCESDRGKGIIRSSDIIGYDGLVTNINEVAIVTFYADCVPLLFFDPVKRVIAESHSGWRGTVKEIASVTIRRMEEEYASSINDIEVAIGPSIGKCCFEVGEEVISEFSEKLPWSYEFCHKTGTDKWHIDLQSIIHKSLINTGINKNNIVSSNVCTKCNKDVFFSHRGDCGKTGSMAAIMQLK